MAKEAGRVRRRERKNISSGVAHVNSSFNNTMITITDAQGNSIAWSSAGAQGFRARASQPRSRRRSRPRTSPRRRGARHADPRSEVCGPGSGRELALRALQAAGFTITSIRDVTTLAWGTCSDGA